MFFPHTLRDVCFSQIVVKEWWWGGNVKRFLLVKTTCMGMHRGRPMQKPTGTNQNSDGRELIEAVVVANRVLQALSAGDAPIPLWDLARKLKLTLPRVYR